MRTESPWPTRNGGWYHVLRESEERRPSLPPPRILLRPAPDWSDLVRSRVAQTSDADLQPHAAALGVSVSSLRELRCFISPRFPGALCAPMWDGLGRVRGIRLRHVDGRKCAVTGSREGLFLPERTPASSTIAIVEGLSDSAAGLDLAPDLDWIGRPSCSGAVAITTALVRFRAPERVIVVADADAPGRRGANSLARKLRLVCRDVRVIVPKARDLRAWCLAGASREAFSNLVQAADPVELLRA